jgi:hypothetical protein
LIDDNKRRELLVTVEASRGSESAVIFAVHMIAPHLRVWSNSAALRSRSMS